MFAVTWSAAAIGCAKSEPQVPEDTGAAGSSAVAAAADGGKGNASAAAAGKAAEPGKGGATPGSSPAQDAGIHLPPTGGAADAGPGTLLTDVSTKGRGACAGVAAADVIAALQGAHPQLADIPSTRDPNIGGDGSFVFSYLRSDGSFAFVVKRGSNDCLAGCIDNEYWYFETDANCKVQQVGHFSKTDDSARNCDVLSGEALWGIPAAPFTGPVCAAESDGADGGVKPDAGTDAVCQERRADFTMKLDAVVKNNLSCASDGDCEIASNSTSCFGSCGVFVNHKGAEAVADFITSAGPAACAADGINCPINPVPPCVPRRAGCVSNMCTDKVE